MPCISRTAAVEMFHRGAVLVRKETLAYSPNDHAHAVMDPCNGWCSHCKTYHLESFGADPFQHPAECPKLSQSITGIFMMETLVEIQLLVVMKI
jgi:hypothetical protein